MPRRRFGHYEVIDFLAILFGYAISGERTLEVFYPRDAQQDALVMEVSSHRPISCSGFLLAKDQKNHCLMKTGEQRRTLSSQITAEL